MIVMPLPEPPIGSLDIKSKASHEDLAVDVPHIDFIFKDRQWMLETCTPSWQILQLSPLLEKVRVCAHCRHQLKRPFYFTLCGPNGLSPTPTPCYATKYPKKRRSFVHLIFEPGGHFPISWSDSLLCYQLFSSLESSFPQRERVDAVRSKKKRPPWWTPPRSLSH